MDDDNSFDIGVLQDALLDFPITKVFGNRRNIDKFAELDKSGSGVDFVSEELDKAGVCAKFKKDLKSDIRAVQLKDEGNTNFAKGSYEAAHQLYTMSLANAESKSIQAIAFANRSAALYRMECFEECLSDINLALESGYPDNLKQKLLLRMENAKKILKPALSFYENVPEIPQTRKNSQIHGATDNIEIKSNTKYGRYVVATKDIEIGEVILVEKPFAAILVKNVWCHCHFCLTLCYNLIPCITCTQVLYCSEGCRKQAWETYHKWECPILLSIKPLDSGSSKALLLRVAFLIRHEIGIAASEQSKDSEDIDVYKSDRYLEICNLRSHSDKRHAADSCAKASVAAFLFQLVKKHSNFFETVNNPPSEKDFRDLLYQLTQICSVNTTEISELAGNPLNSHILGLQQVAFAKGIFSFFNMFNHSCSANVTRNFYGSSVVLRACKSIKKGQQCFASYGPRYHTSPKNDRQAKLERSFFFQCDCMACSRDWPLMKYLLPGPDISDQLDLPFIFERLCKADVALATKILPMLIKVLKKYEKHEPCFNMCFVSCLLQQCFDLFGNKTRDIICDKN